jgi:hypothetical protein
MSVVTCVLELGLNDKDLEDIIYAYLESDDAFF